MKILEDVEKRQTHIADIIKKIKAEWDEEYKKKPSQSEQSRKKSEQSKKKSEQSKTKSEQSKKKSEQSKKKSEQSRKKSEQSKKKSEQSKKKSDASIKNNRKRKSKEELNLDSRPVTDTKKKFKKDSSKTNESLQKCQCGCCSFRDPKDICCVQIVNSIIAKYPEEKKKTCLTKWKVIGESVVNRSFLEDQNKENKWTTRTPKSNKQFYLVACKVFTRLMYGKLGKGEWRDIPSCVKNEIGKYFPCRKYKNKRKSF